MESPVPNPDPNIVFDPPIGPVDRYFPLVTPPPNADTFEIGLVLGGTVSAGAYTAGVLDFLIEAMDAWTAAKKAGQPGVPSHNVIIKIVAGTSGGGINAVILARALGHSFPPYPAAQAANNLSSNPFYNLWVDQIDIADLLKTTDLKEGQPIPSLLCADKIVSATSQFIAAPLTGTAISRPYVANPLPVVLTLTNLRGVPYWSDFKGTGKREYFTDHADYIRFAVDISGSAAMGSLQPYEVGISDSPTAGIQPWKTIAAAALGTSAFPIGLPARSICRDVEHYRYRPMVVKTTGGPPAIWMRPAWEYMIPIGETKTTPYQFLAVDGGCIDNEPVELARTYLAGLTGQNEREAHLAHRAVLLVDPFADTPAMGLKENPGLLGIVGPFLGALVANGRFETADLDLFTDQAVYSRFLVSAVRADPADEAKTLTGGAALAGAGLAAFLGFMSQSYRRHDFLLGRRNCQQFLRRWFFLDDNNSLFGGPAPTAPAGSQRPIIPLIGSANIDQSLPAWPAGTFNPDSIHDQVADRIERMLEIVEKDQLPWPFNWMADAFVNGTVAGRVADKFVSVVRDEIGKAKL